MWRKLALVTLALWLCGCTAVHTSISKGKLDVQTRMTDTIFLDPVEPGLRSVYLDIRQTADKPMEGLDEAVRELLLSRGYTILDSPGEAHYWLQVNLRTVRKVHPRELLTQGEFAMTHEEIARLMDPAARLQPDYQPRVPAERSMDDLANNVYIYADLAPDIDLDISSKDLRRALIAVAVIAGAEYAGRQLVKDVYYTMITDIQVAERVDTENEMWVQELSQQNLLQGEGSSELIWTRNLDRRKYQARIISYANKANLRWEQAEPSLYQGLARSLSGIF